MVIAEAGGAAGLTVGRAALILQQQQKQEAEQAAAAAQQQQQQVQAQRAQPQTPSGYGIAGSEYSKGMAQHESPAWMDTQLRDIGGGLQQYYALNSVTGEWEPISKPMAKQYTPSGAPITSQEDKSVSTVTPGGVKITFGPEEQVTRSVDRRELEIDSEGVVIGTGDYRGAGGKEGVETAIITPTTRAVYDPDIGSKVNIEQADPAPDYFIPAITSTGGYLTGQGYLDIRTGIFHAMTTSYTQEQLSALYGPMAAMGFLERSGKPGEVTAAGNVNIGWSYGTHEQMSRENITPDNITGLLKESDIVSPYEKVTAKEGTITNMGGLQNPQYYWYMNRGMGGYWKYNIADPSEQAWDKNVPLVGGGEPSAYTPPVPLPGAGVKYSPGTQFLVDVAGKAGELYYKNVVKGIEYIRADWPNVVDEVAGKTGSFHDVSMIIGEAGLQITMGVANTGYALTGGFVEVGAGAGIIVDTMRQKPGEVIPMLAMGAGMVAGGIVSGMKERPLETGISIIGPIVAGYAAGEAAGVIGRSRYVESLRMSAATELNKIGMPESVKPVYDISTRGSRLARGTKTGITPELDMSLTTEIPKHVTDIVAEELVREPHSVTGGAAAGVQYEYTTPRISKDIDAFVNNPEGIETAIQARMKGATIKGVTDLHPFPEGYPMQDITPKVDIESMPPKSSMLGTRLLGEPLSEIPTKAQIHYGAAGELTYEALNHLAAKKYSAIFKDITAIEHLDYYGEKISAPRPNEVTSRSLRLSKDALDAYLHMNELRVAAKTRGESTLPFDRAMSDLNRIFNREITTRITKPSTGEVVERTTTIGELAAEKAATSMTDFTALKDMPLEIRTGEPVAMPLKIQPQPGMLMVTPDIVEVKMPNTLKTTLGDLAEQIRSKTPPRISEEPITINIERSPPYDAGVLQKYYENMARNAAPPIILESSMIGASRPSAMRSYSGVSSTSKPPGYSKTPSKSEPPSSMKSLGISSPPRSYIIDSRVSVPPSGIDTSTTPYPSTIPSPPPNYPPYPSKPPIPPSIISTSKLPSQPPYPSYPPYPSETPQPRKLDDILQGPSKRRRRGRKGYRSGVYVNPLPEMAYVTGEPINTGRRNKRIEGIL